MTDAKPPERVTLCLDANGCIARHGEGTDYEYILASAVEKRERALRIALETIASGNLNEVEACNTACKVLDNYYAALAATKKEKGE